MHYSIHADITEDEARFVRESLIRFADSYTGPRNYREFGVVLRDERGVAVGGITANTVWDWLQIDMLWIPESLRGLGHGLNLLMEAEAIGRKMGCQFSKLDTFEFEAREFYERCGYTVRSQTDEFPAGHVHYHLWKTL